MSTQAEAEAAEKKAAEEAAAKKAAEEAKKAEEAEPAEDWDPPMVSLWLPQSDATTGLPVNADGPGGFHPATHPPDRSPRITLLEQRSLLLL